MFLLQEKAHDEAQAALRREASLRAQLKGKLKAKREARSRAVKRLEECPGVNGPSVSGKRMKKLPSYWEQKKKRESNVPDCPAELHVGEVTGEMGATAGLLGGLDATFSFSPMGKDNFVFAGE